jgi:hypothetical protein
MSFETESSFASTTLKSFKKFDFSSFYRILSTDKIVLTTQWQCHRFSGFA